MPRIAYKIEPGTIRHDALNYHKESADNS